MSPFVCFGAIFHTKMGIEITMGLALVELRGLEPRTY